MGRDTVAPRGAGAQADSGEVGLACAREAGRAGPLLARADEADPHGLRRGEDLVPLAHGPLGGARPPDRPEDPPGQGAAWGVESDHQSEEDPHRVRTPGSRLPGGQGDDVGHHAVCVQVALDKRPENTGISLSLLTVAAFRCSFPATFGPAPFEGARHVNILRIILIFTRRKKSE